LKANKELEFIKANSVKVAHFQDEDYPERLANIDGPVLLFSPGEYRFKKPQND
jgi:DNA processing protein